MCVNAFTEPFAFALQPTASRAPLSPSMLRSLTPWTPHQTPRSLIESTPRAAFISRRGNPSQSVLVPRTAARRKSRFVTGASVEIFSISRVYPPTRESAFVLFADVAHRHGIPLLMEMSRNRCCVRSLYLWFLQDKL